MKTRFILIIICIVALFSLNHYTYADNLPALETVSIKTYTVDEAPTLLRKTSASIVSINATYKDDDGKESSSIGTGFFVSWNNNIFIVSAGHLIKKNGEYKAFRMDLNTKKETVFSLKLVAADSDLDLAIFSFDKASLEFTLEPLALADSSLIKPGDWVLAIGAANGIYLHYTDGFISNLFDTDQGEYFFHSAPINQGNSGGPLINLKGEVVGINLAYFPPQFGWQSISMARPSHIIKNFINKNVK